LPGFLDPFPERPGTIPPVFFQRGRSSLALAKPFTLLFSAEKIDAALFRE